MPQLHKEKILFHKGLGFDARSPLMEPGYLRQVDGWYIDKDGVTRTLMSHAVGAECAITAAMTPLAGIQITATSFVQLYDAATATSKMFYSASPYTTATEVTAGTVPNGTLDIGGWSPNMVQQYGNMHHIFGANGGHLMIETSTGNMFNGQIRNPATAPTAADSGSGGNPDGVYKCYVSFLFTFPGGMTYETGLSPASGDVTVATNQIAWTAIPVATSNQYVTRSGSVAITRKLYRGPGTGGALADIYYVATIADNTTTTYTDDASDATLIANGVCDVEEYLPIGAWSNGYTRLVENAFGCFHYGRLYTIPKTVTYWHRLYYSEAAAGDTASDNEIILPLASKANNWLDLRTCVPYGGAEPMGLVSWGSYLYIALRRTWIKKSGEEPDTWAIKKTFALHGVAASATICFIEEADGIAYLTQDHSGRLGVAIFNGDSSRLVASPKLDDILNENQQLVNTFSPTHTSAVKIGPYYILHFAYGQGISGAISAGVVNYILDFSRYPDVRVTKSLRRKGLVAWADAAATCHCYLPWSNTQHMILNEVISVGGVYTLRGCLSSTAPLSIAGSSYINDSTVLRTHGYCGGLENITRKKRLLKLKYSLQFAADDTTLPPQISIYLDGSSTPVTLNAFGDTEAKDLDGGGSATKEKYCELPFPQGLECYVYEISIAPQAAAGTKGIEIYSPWEVEMEILD